MKLMTGTLLSPCPVVATVTSENVTPLSELDIAPFHSCLEEFSMDLQIPSRESHTGKASC